jgi:hypothetical protein
VNAPSGVPTTVTWSSSNSSVASVSTDGLVTGVSAGPVAITACSTENTSACGQATVTVLAQVPATISIQAVTNTVAGTGEVPVNINNVAGQINVALNFEPGSTPATSVELLIDDVVVASQGFSSLQWAELVANALEEGGDLAKVVIVLSVNTAEFNAETGVPSFLNGPRQLTARAILQGGDQVATPSQTLLFNNEDMVVVTTSVANGASANDADGLLWYTGDLTATAVVVVFSSSAEVQQVVFNPSPAGLGSNVVDDEAPFTASWTKDDDAAGLEDAAVDVFVTSTVGGNTGPSATSEELRIDNAGPAAGTLELTAQDVDGDGDQTPCCDNNWVGPVYAFENGYTGGTDGGVGGITATFHVLSSTDGPDADDVVADGEAVSTGADIDAETTLNSDLRLAMSECDALANCTNTLKTTDGGTNTGSDIGHDKIAPVIAVGAGTIAADDINNGAPAALPYNVTLTSENLSGIAASPLLAFATGNFTTSDFDAATCFAPSILDGDDCFADLVAGLSTSVAAVDATNKYVNMVLVVWDRAGNVSNELSRDALHDNTAPTIDPFLPPSATLAGGAAAAFSSTANDNVDLESGDLLVEGTIPVTAAQSLGSFGSPLTEEAAVSGSTPWIRSINTVATTNAVLRAFDVAGNVGTQAAAVTTTGTPVAVPGTFSIETAAFSVCSTEPDCDGADSPTSEDVTVRIRGITGTFANPFDGGGYVLLYFTDGLGRNHFIGKATAFQTNDDNVNRDYIYTITFNALGLEALKYAIADGTAIDVTAVGVTAAGDAITLTSVGLATIEQ